jgi:hypothetical protein
MLGRPSVQCSLRERRLRCHYIASYTCQHTPQIEARKGGWRLSTGQASHHHPPGLCDHRVYLRRKRSIWLVKDRERTSLDQETKRLCMITAVWYPIRTLDVLLSSFCCSCRALPLIILFMSLFPLVVAIVRLCREYFRCISVALIASK